MADREKIIEALENAYVENGNIKISVQFRDMFLLPLLKEQDPVRPQWDPDEREHRCPSCGEKVESYVGSYCSGCGRRLDWDGA